MALNFPLVAAEFMDLLRIQDVFLQPGDHRQVTGLRGGEILTAEIAPPLWQGSCAVRPMKARAAAEIQARLAMLDKPGRAFEVYKANQIGPASDPKGVALAGYTPEILELHGDPERLRLSGLPAGFEIRPGDFLAFDYDAGFGPRRALHQVVIGRTADASGEILSGQNITVTPAIRPGAAIGAAVQLVKPACLAVIVPGSISYGTTMGGITSGISFQFRQTLRG